MRKVTKLSVLCATLMPFATASAFDIYENDDVTIAMGGRLQLDTLIPLGSDGDDDYDFNVRRARVFIGGDFYEDWEAKLQIDFANAIDKGEDDNRVDIKDAWLKYKGIEGATLQAGQFKAPMSLQELTSSKYITILERATVVDELAISRKVGLGVTHSADAYTLSAGLFGDSLQESSDHDEWGPVARAVWHPYGGKNGLVHLGASVSQRWSDVEDGDTLTYGFEAASVYGSAHGQFEYMAAETDEETLDGWYAQAGYFLTGESRPYKQGAFKGVKPNNTKLGAWEVAARYGQFEGDDQVDLGVNWYANKYVRVSTNYVMPDEGDDIIQTRLQFAF